MNRDRAYGLAGAAISLISMAVAFAVIPEVDAGLAWLFTVLCAGMAFVQASMALGGGK